MNSNIKLSTTLLKSNMRPSRLMLISMTVYIINLLFGPYNYTFYSKIGILYFFLCFFLLWLGAFVAESKRSNPIYLDYHMTPLAEVFLCIFMIIVLVANIYVFYYYTKLSGIPYSEVGLAGARNILARNLLPFQKPQLVKIAEVLVTGGVTSYLIISGLNYFNYNITTFLAPLCLIGSVANNLLVGARATTVTIIVLFMIVNIIRKQRKQLILLKRWVNLILYLTIPVAIFIVMMLFVTRSGASVITDLEPESVYLFYRGDISYKPFYSLINNLFGGRLSLFYYISLYYSHSIPVFTWLFNNSDYSNYYYGGALQFRIIGFIFETIGWKFKPFLDIVYSQPHYGYYRTFLQGVLLDWGLYFTPIIVFITGIFFGIVHRKYIYGRFWAITIYPLIIIMCIVLPVYYFWHWAVIDFSLFIFLSLMPVLYFLGIKKICRKHNNT